MLGNAIKQTTTTTGTGNLTLAGVAGYPTLANAFVIGQPFAYSLLDAAGLFLEAGIGYLLDATTMVRVRVTATFVGNVYTKEAAAPVTLAGVTTVLCTPNAATLMTALPTVDGQSSNVARLVTSAGRSVSQSPQPMSANIVYYVPFLLRTGADVTALGIGVQNAGAGVARTGVYAVNEKGYMGKLLATTGDLDVSTSGFKMGTLAQAISLPPGDYYSAVVSSVGFTVTAYTTNGTQTMGGGPLGFNAGNIQPWEFRSESVGSAVLPANAAAVTSATAFGATHPPCVFLGVQ